MAKRLCLLFSSVLLYYGCFAQDSIDITITLFFKTNSFELNAQQHDSIKQFLRSYPAIMQITGYADTTGRTNANLALSKKRAFAVYDVIKSNSGLLDTNSIAYYGESEERPQRWMNRRVQIHARKLPAQAFEKSNAQTIGDTVRELDLENIYFIPDKAIFSQESIPYIQDLARVLKGFSEGTFEIIGHVNYQRRVDSTHLSDLYALSRLRAKAVYDYLVELGIPATRMTYRGVGNSQPLIAAPKNDAEKRKNMRVQVIIRKR